MGVNRGGIRFKIKQAYLKNKKVADDDALLLSEIWLASGWDSEKPLLANLRNMPSPETIRRTRQKMVSEGEIVPSLDATERRYKNFKKVRSALGYELY